MLKIALIDDHAVLRDGLRAALSAQPDIEVAGDAYDAATTHDLLENQAIDVLVLDVGLPDPGGIGIARETLRQHPDAKILFLSMHGRVETVAEALATGALGYAEKDQPIADIATAIRTVAAGQSYLSPRISRVLVDEYTRMRREPGQPPAGPLGVLTEREREVFSLLVRAHSNKTVAAELGITPRTAETHRARIMQKLKVRSISELFRFAADHGLLATNPPAAPDARSPQAHEF